MNRNLQTRFRTFIRSAVFLAVLIAGFTVLDAETSVAPEPGDLRAAGTVDFKVSCAPDARSEFIRGVALLHSFFYEEARRIFASVAEQDPNCAMAQWGIAMTWWHPIWTPPTSGEMSAGKAAIQKAMAMKGGTDLERGFITALNAYYNTPDRPTTGEVGQSCHGPVGPRDRVMAYEKAMRTLYERYPDDVETQTFYALAVLAVGYANPTDTTLSNQLKAARILEKLWNKNPHHPGVAHYLIHSYVYPSLAERGLAAARSYGSIAPWVPHALHMPEWPHSSSFPFTEALIEYAHALGRAHTGDLEGARKAMDRMRQLRDATSDPKFDYFKRQLDQQMQAASAWVAYGENKKDDAINILRRVADAEDILGKHPVSPGALVPAREQLGDLLLKLDRPKEAQREFEAALKIYPGRFRGLYGAAHAAEQIGEKEKAHHYYAKLIEQTAKADGSRGELAQMREYHAGEGAATQP